VTLSQNHYDRYLYKGADREKVGYYCF